VVLTNASAVVLPRLGFDRRGFPLGSVVWLSGDGGCCSEAYQTANEYRQVGAHVANSKTGTTAIRSGMSICPCA
jgi:hypothetical protein